MTRPGPAVWSLALALAFLVFGLWPGIDTEVAGWFFDGAGFPVAANPGVEALRRALYVLEDTVGVLAFVLAAWACKAGPLLGQGARVWLYQGLVFLLGPALLVNGVLKPLWSRPRPFRITDFGGPDAFQTIWHWHGACLRNCSFTSGEVASAMALALMGMMLAQANRARLGQLGHRLAVVAAILPLPFTAWQRLAAGKHFLSDAVLSVLVIGLLASILARALAIKASVTPC